jgi:predicted nucleotidyltransferase
MDLNKPLGVITPTVDAEVLSVLAGANETFTGVRVHQIIGSSTQKTVWTALQRLSDQGIVLKVQKGSAGLYSLNRDHLAAPYILGLANLKGELLERMTKAITHWEIKPVFAAVFGSAARGEMRLDSDIDIFIVRPDKVDADDDLWVSLHAELSDSMTESEVARGLAANERVLSDIREQGLRLLGDQSLIQATVKIKKTGTRRGQ